MSEFCCPECRAPEESITGHSDLRLDAAGFLECSECGSGFLIEELAPVSDFADTVITGEDLPHFDEDGFETDVRF